MAGTHTILAEMISVILNPASGTARRPGLAEEIGGLFRNAGVDAAVHTLGDPRGAAMAARGALQDRADVVVAAGGDGTVSAVAAELAGKDVPLGVLPLGTMNHFARDARIPIDLPGAVATIASGRPRRVDIGRVNAHLFINNSSIGVYPDIVTLREQLRADGYPKWLAAVSATRQVLRRESEISIRLAAGSAEKVVRSPFLFVGNNEYRAEGIRMGARVRLDGGELWGYFAPPVRTRDLPKLFARALLGRARREHVLEAIAGPQLWVDSLTGRDLVIACDGEVLNVASPLHYRAWPAALRVLMPAT